GRQARRRRRRRTGPRVGSHSHRSGSAVRAACRNRRRTVHAPGSPYHTRYSSWRHTVGAAQATTLVHIPGVGLYEARAWPPPADDRGRAPCRLIVNEETHHRCQSEAGLPSDTTFPDRPVAGPSRSLAVVGGAGRTPPERAPRLLSRRPPRRRPP